MIMPAFVLGTSLAATLMRHTRSAMLGVMKADYVRTARAKGVREHAVVIKHAFRNALLPVVTLSALLFGELLGGAVLTEQIFTIPGFGKLIVDAVFTRDYAVVRSEEHTSELQSLMSISYAVFCLKKKYIIH